MSAKEWIVEVVTFETEEVVKRIPCWSERDANRVDDGLNINLDHEHYFTRISTKDAA